MKQNRLISQSFKTLLIFMLLFTFGTTVHAKKEGCWAKFYEHAEFKGKHFKLTGSKQKKNLLTIEGENWDKRIESILIGPKAVVTVFENKNFKLTLKEMANHPVLMKSLGVTKQDILEDSEMILHSNARIHSFGEFNFYHKIRSLQISCN